MHTVYIGIGSNLGDRQKNCETAVELIKASKFAKNVIISKWYETKPLLPRCRTPFGGTSGKMVSEGYWPSFINGAIRIETELFPRELLGSLQKIEAELGRIRRSNLCEPRTIDLDILFYDDLIIDEPDLKIPHPEAHKRMFVLEPLCDIAPDLKHPVLSRTVKQLKARLR